jgi:hypothetical protein
VQVEFSPVGQDERAQRGHRLGRRPGIGDGVTLPRQGARLVEVAAPEVDDRFAVEVDGGGGSDIVTFEGRGKGVPHSGEPFVAAAVHFRHVQHDNRTITW